MKAKINAETLGWNIVLYALSVVLMVALIEHSIFFYGWPPRMDVWIDLPPQLFFGYGGLLYFILKVWHYVEVKSASLKEDD